MKTTTIEPERPELVNVSEVERPETCPDPDRPIEGTGGPSDGGSQAHGGPGNPPPSQAY